MTSLIAAADPAAERFVRELLADRDYHLHALVGLAQIDVARGDLQAARFHADRLIRLAPDRLDYASFNAALALRAGDRRAALSFVARAERHCGLDATLLRIGLQAASAEGQTSSVTSFARRLCAFGALEAESIEALDRVLSIRDASPGWVAATQEGGLVGALRPDCLPSAVLAWQCAGEVERRVPLARTAALRETGFLVRFQFAPQDLPTTGRLELEAGGRALFGSPIRLPVRPVVLGAVEERLGEIEGWAWAPGCPETTLSVAVTDEAGRRIEIRADEPSPAARALVGASPACGFRLDGQTHALAPGALRFAALGVPLSGSPLPAGHGKAQARFLASRRRAAVPLRDLHEGMLTAEALAQTPILARVVGDLAPPMADARRPVGTAVLIPVYDGKEESLACLTSVLRSVPNGTRIVVVDDASPDPALSDAVSEMARRGAITLLRNESNLGYPRSVNRGLAELSGHDVVLLNADALVANDWLERLRAACYREPDIGTVTALAPSGSIASYGAGEDDPDLDEVAAIDRAAAAVNAGWAVDVPTGVGHCLFIRADCLDEVGRLDAETFGRGYGEENDFCLRARAIGWRSVVAADVFVGHIGERSFGSQRRILSHRNGAILERLYPGYDAVVARHIAEDPLARARRRIDLRRLEGGSPAMLIVTMGWKGGVAAHVGKRVEALQATGQSVLQLQPVPPSSATQRRRLRLVVEDRPDLRDLVFDEEEFGDLVALLKRLNVAAMEIHHTLHHDPRVLDLPRHLGTPYAIVVHDYSWICPRMALVGGSGSYCGVPDAAECDRCVASFGSISDEPIGVGALRARSRRMFEGAQRVVVPCDDVLARLKPHAGTARLTVTPWDASRPEPRPFPLSRRLRVAIPGGIGLHKGFAVLRACAEDAARRDLPLDFVVIGYSEDDNALLKTGHVFVTGEYEPGELQDLIALSRSNVAFLPSICPETWSYTLSEVWKSGLEALAFDIGAIAERIKTHGGGRILPLDASARTANDFLLEWKLAQLPRAAANATGDVPHPDPRAFQPAFSTPKAKST